MSGTKSTKKRNNDSKTSKKQIIIVMGVVLNNNRVLMTQRFEEECPDAHLKWELPGGKIKFGEEPNITIEREIYEETGVKVKAQALIPIVRTCIWNYKIGIIQHTILLGYFCKFLRQDSQEKKDHHVEKFEWVRISDLHKKDILPGDEDFINEARKQVFVEQGSKRE